MKEKIERFTQYMKYKGLNDNQVTVQCGIGVGVIGQARKGKSDLGAKTITKILEKYQDLNRVWLLTGEGSMLIDIANSTVQSSDKKVIEGDNNINNQNGIDSKTINKFLDEIAAQRRLTEKAHEQTDRLLNIIEKLKLN